MGWEPVGSISKTRPDRKRRLDLARGAHKEGAPSWNKNAADGEYRETLAEHDQLPDNGPIETFSAQLMEHDIESAPSGHLPDGKPNSHLIDRYACNVAAKYEEVDES